MIHDREYKRSCVRAVSFPTAALRQIFFYLREREDVLMRDLFPADSDEVTTRRISGEDLDPILVARIREVRAMLIWLVTNIENSESGKLSIEERISKRRGE